MGTYDGNHQVEVEYPTAFAKAMMQERRAGKFRYVHLGGAFTVEDQGKTLWFMPTARRGRVCYLLSNFLPLYSFGIRV